MIPIFLLFCLYNNLFAQWNTNTQVNTPVCTFTGKQGDPRIIETIDSGAYIAWKDWRNGTTNPDIFLQKLDKFGNIKWAINGLSLCDNIKDQSTPNLVADGAGGVIVTWSDWRSGVERDLYAQRVDSNGNIVWTYNGVPAANKTNREHNEKIISDDKGGAIIVWEQQSAGKWDVWANRLDANGTPLWTAGGKVMCTIVANRLNPKVQSDKQSGAYIVWQDDRIVGNYNIYAQHVDSNGNLQWSTNALQICNANGNQINPKIDPDIKTRGVYICWIDKRNNIDYDLYAQRIDSSGNLLWGTSGKPVIVADSNQSAQDILSNSKTNGLVVVWKDKRPAAGRKDHDLYMQKLNENGDLIWNPLGVLIDGATTDQSNPNICKDAKNGAIVVYEEGETTNMNIKTQRIDSLGNLLWSTANTVVTNAIGKQSGPKNIADGQGGTIVVWEDERIATDRNIFAHHINANGTSWPLKINYQTLQNVRVYPNPNKGIFTIESENELSIAQMQLVTLDGKIIPFGFLQKSKNNFEVNCKNIPEGIYFLQIKNNQYWTKEKIVIQ